MAKISVYINNRASQTNSISWEEELNKFLFRHDVNYHIPKNLEQLNLQVLKDIADDVDYIFSVGGDGTANLIAQHLALTNIKLMLIPFGTANDLAGELGINRSLKKIIKIFQNNTSKKIDLIKINDCYMLTNGGIGLASSVAKKINNYRKRSFKFKKLMKKLGAKTYSLFLANEIIKSSLVFYDLIIESEDFHLSGKPLKTAMVLVNNQEVLGGDFCISPGTKNDDGQFNVLIFLHRNKIELVQVILKILLRKDVSRDSNLISFETNYLKIKNLKNDKIDFLGDGEVLESNCEFEVSVENQAINVCSYNDDLLNYKSYPLEQVSLV